MGSFPTLTTCCWFATPPCSYLQQTDAGLLGFGEGEEDEEDEGESEEESEEEEEEEKVRHRASLLSDGCSDH